MFDPATQEVIVDGENLTKEVWGNLASMWQDDLDRAEEEQVKLMQAERRLTGGERKNLDFGYIRFRLCPEVFAFWTEKLGEKIWQDESFKKWLGKRFDHLVKIKSVSNKIVV
tara:strand:- start:1152 stop:1487 length:336 start_codon:yes stop_codon:yes gene_type:complete